MRKSASDPGTTTIFIQNYTKCISYVGSWSRVTTRMLLCKVQRAESRSYGSDGFISVIFVGYWRLNSCDAFWALFLPTTAPGHVSYIWRGYFAQPLFWKCELYLAFSSALVEQPRNTHGYMGDFATEPDLYQKSGTLLQFLQSWKPKFTHK